MVFINYFPEDSVPPRYTEMTEKDIAKGFISNGKRFSTPLPDSISNPSDFLICGGTSYVPEDGITGLRGSGKSSRYIRIFQGLN